MISNNNIFEKFLNYDENKDLFGRFKQEEYVYEISKILGFQEKEIFFGGINHA